MRRLIINLSGHPMPERRGTVILSPRYQIDPDAQGRLGPEIAFEHAIAPVRELLATADKWVIKSITRGKFSVVLPGLSWAAGAVIAYLHAIAGHFPKILWSYRTEDGFVWTEKPGDLQTIREKGRVERTFEL